MDWFAVFWPSSRFDQGPPDYALPGILSLFNASRVIRSPNPANSSLHMITNGIGADESSSATIDQAHSEKIWKLLPGCARSPRNITHPIVRQVQVQNLEASSYTRQIYVFCSEQDLHHSTFVYVHENSTHVTSFQILKNHISQGKYLSLSTRSLKRRREPSDLARLVGSFCHSFRLPHESCINEEALVLTITIVQCMLQAENDRGILDCSNLPFGIRNVKKVHALKNWSEYVRRHSDAGSIVTGTWCNPPLMLTLFDDHLKDQGYFQCYIYDHLDQDRLPQFAYLFFVDFRDEEFLQAFNHRNFSFDDVAAAAVFCFAHIENFLAKKHASTVIRVRKTCREEFLNQTEFVAEGSSDAQKFETQVVSKIKPGSLNEEDPNERTAQSPKKQSKNQKKKAKKKANKQKLDNDNKGERTQTNEKLSKTTNGFVESRNSAGSAGDAPPSIMAVNVGCEASCTISEPCHFISSGCETSHSATSWFDNRTSPSSQIFQPDFLTLPKERSLLGKPSAVSAVLEAIPVASIDRVNSSKAETTNSEDFACAATISRLPGQSSEPCKSGAPTSFARSRHHCSTADNPQPIERNQQTLKQARGVKSTYPSSLLFSYASEDRINCCWLPSCRKRTTPLKSTTTICPRCSINSYVRYCNFDHLLKDILRHYQFDCCRRLNPLLVDTVTQPERQLPWRRFIAVDIQAGAIDTPERHRQATCRSIYTDQTTDYFIFGDLDVLWSQHGFDYAPTKQDVQQIRCQGEIIARICLIDPLDKLNLNSLIETLLAKGVAAGFKWIQDDKRLQQKGLNDPLNLLYIWLKEDLLRRGGWDEKMCDRLCFQMQFEFGHKVDELLR